MSLPPRDNLDEVIATIDVESWLDREGLKYRKNRGARGLQLNVKECPCCGNSSYKVYLNADTGLGNCFHGDCEAKFNKWSFIKAYLGGDNRTAVEHVKAVAREQGWRPPSRSKAVEIERPDLRLPTSIALPHNGRNLKYLDKRGITGDIANYFSLRFSHRGVFEYLDDDGRPASQDYSNRVIIPIFDLEGQLVSFQGRDITGTADKKYLFPPGYASTGSILYNGHNAVGAERIALGEGVFDVAALKIALDGEMALRDVIPVGTFGKHLSVGADDSQMAKILYLKGQGLKQVTFIWDGEERAIQDALDAALQLHSVGLVARLAVLPPDKDPNEVVPFVVRQAFYRARVVTPSSALRLRMMGRLAFDAAL
jgi:DNA primase